MGFVCPARRDVCGYSVARVYPTCIVASLWYSVASKMIDVKQLKFMIIDVKLCIIIVRHLRRLFRRAAFAEVVASRFP